MYTAYANEMIQDDFYYEQQEERHSDVAFPPVVNALLLVIWLVFVAAGMGVIFIGGSPLAGAVVIGVPTFIGMVIKPTFALSIMMLVLPTGAGIAYNQVFSLDRGVGIAVGVAFLLNLLITRPRLHLRRGAIWCIGLFTLWICLASALTPMSSYYSLELRRAFTHVQLLGLVLIVYLILETNDFRTFIWTLRSYVIGSLGTILLTFMTGAAVRSMQDEGQARYAATLGSAIDANMLASLTCIAFLAAVYLIARDKSLFWRLLYFVAILSLPVMLLKIGSRGALIALVFTLLSPLIFLRQVMMKPALAILLMMVILFASLSAGLVLSSGGLETPVLERLSDVSYAMESLVVRLQPIKKAIGAVADRPLGTSYYGWFERTGSVIWPHNDFFLVLGVYGIPGVTLFIAIVLMMIRVIKRTPLGMEKLFTRSVLVFLLIMGLNIGQLSHKYFWVFLAFVIAGQRFANMLAPDTDEPLVHECDYDDSPDYALT